jgi:flagellum-specific ATP synthase
VTPSPQKIDFTPFRETIDTTPFFNTTGSVTRLVGIGLEATLPDPVQGQVVEVEVGTGERVICEVVGFDTDRVFLLPYGELIGVRPGAPVRTVSNGMRINCGDFLIGRVVDGLGNPIDGKGPFPRGRATPLDRHGPNPVTRPLIDKPIVTGVRAVDAVTTIGKGQRVGIFSGSGVGKSILIGMTARNTRADVNVIALIGERGREVREFLENDLGEAGLNRSVVIVATSNQTPLLRMRGAMAATAIAEYFRDTSRDVLFMMDSLTRFALAGREVGLAVGEPPATRGYPPSVFGLIPKLLERAGRTENGSITGMYSVLVEGDDLAEPVSDIARATLDGHIVLSRELADKGHYPAIDVLTSISRVMRQIVENEQVELVAQLRQLIAAHRDMQDLINIGAYQSGTNPNVDYAIARMDGINSFLRQGIDEIYNYESLMDDLSSAVGGLPSKAKNQNIKVSPPPPAKLNSSGPNANKQSLMPKGAYED